MKTYLELLRHVRAHGTRKDDRTGTGTLSVFGWQSRYRLSDGFPLVTTKNCILNPLSMSCCGLCAGYEYRLFAGKWCAYLG